MTRNFLLLAPGWLEWAANQLNIGCCVNGIHARSGAGKSSDAAGAGRFARALSPGSPSAIRLLPTVSYHRSWIRVPSSGIPLLVPTRFPTPISQRFLRLGPQHKCDDEGQEARFAEFSDNSTLQFPGAAEPAVRFGRANTIFQPGAPD